MNKTATIIEDFNGAKKDNIRAKLRADASYESAGGELVNGIQRGILLLWMRQAYTLLTLTAGFIVRQATISTTVKTTVGFSPLRGGT